MTTTPTTVAPTIQRFRPSDDLAEIAAAPDEGGAVIVEGLLSSQVVRRVNEEVEAAVAAADPEGPLFNPIAGAFIGSFTRNVPSSPWWTSPSRTAPPGWCRANHRWPDRYLPMDQQMTPTAGQIVAAEMFAGSAVVYPGGVIHGGGANVTSPPRRAVHLSHCLGWLRTEENNSLSMPPAIAAALPREAKEVIGDSVYHGITRGGGYLGMVRMQDPGDLLADEL